jgi:Putative multicopper oxidases
LQAGVTALGTAAVAKFAVPDAFAQSATRNPLRIPPVVSPAALALTCAPARVDLGDGNAPHPVHVHGASFQVASRTGGHGFSRGRAAGRTPPSCGTRSRWTCWCASHRQSHYVGPQLYVMHCHQLEHEDMGMMSNFEVV